MLLAYTGGKGHIHRGSGKERERWAGGGGGSAEKNTTEMTKPEEHGTVELV